VSETGNPAPPRPAKGASAYRTIGEVADDLDLPAHVLRFWESKFAQLKPLKRAGGRRYYRPEDVALLRRIRQCLYQDGYTIRGVQKLLGGAGERPAPPSATEEAPSLFPLDPRGEPDRRPRRRTLAPETRAALEDIRRELLEAKQLLDGPPRRPKQD
jgi:DNA-binding transcriptional MerR regulator